MEKNKEKRRYRMIMAKKAFGVLLFLFALLIFLSPNTRLFFFGYGVCFLFGSMGIYLIPLLFGYLSFLILFPKRKALLNKRIWFGIILLSLASLILLSHIANKGSEGFSSFPSLMDELSSCLKKNSYQGGFHSDLLLGGGAVGLFLSSLLNLAGNWLVILAIVVIYVLALLTLFFPLLIKLYRFILAKLAIKKALKQAIKKEDEDGVTELDLGKEEEKPNRPSFLDSYSFSPSSSLEYSSRRRKDKAESTPEEKESVAPSINPHPSVSRSPLEEAIFSPFAKDEPLPKKESLIEASPLPEAKEESKGQEKEIAFSFAKEDEPMEEPIIEEAVEAKEEAVPAFEIKEEPVAKKSAIPLVEEKEEIIEKPKEATPAEPKKEKDPYEVDDASPLPKYVFPGLDLLEESKEQEKTAEMEEDCRQKAAILDQAFIDFGIGAHVQSYTIGPTVTRYDIATDASVQASNIERVRVDLGRILGGLPLRFQPMILGKTTSGLEVENAHRSIVSFKDTFKAMPNGERKNLYIPFGKNIEGEVVSGDLGEFPHLLVSGTTGSGKSVFMHGMLMSLIMRNRPEHLKLLLIDPKRVEFTKYKELPHLLCPIVKEPSHARVALEKLVALMDRRYEIFDRCGVRDIREFNSEYAEENNKAKMPFIIVVVDEFADLVDQEKTIPESVLRIAQKARACGIHLIIATQRPDVKVITGTIKANLPARVALSVSSAADSMTILGVGGAEDLIGYGDMLIDCDKVQKKGLLRCQGCYVESKEIKRVCDFIRNQLPPLYDSDFLDLEDHEEQLPVGDTLPSAPSASEMRATSAEDKYQQIKRAIIAREYTSISQIQREFGVGFPRAGKIMTRLQQEGIVASAQDTPNSSKGFKVLIHELPKEEGEE